MPNRLLRDCTDSENINQLTYPAEVLFYRLMMKADDYGSFYANTKLLKASCYPLRIDTVRDADITRWMDELQKAGLIVVYMDAGKSYLRIVNFGQRLRNKKKRFPDCPMELLAISRELPQPAANGRELPPEVEVEVEVEGELKGAAHVFSGSNLYRKPVIPLLKDVKAVFYQQGGTQDQALRFFAKHEATGWYLNNSPIVSWPSLVPSFLANWKEIEQDSGTSEKPRIVV